MRCDVCEYKPPFAYNCNECDFLLDVKCVVSIVHPPPRDHDQSRSTDDRRDQIHHFSHPHQLTTFHAKAKLLASCDVCNEGISGDFYCCPDCLFLLHPSCAKLTQEIVHPLHPGHHLICQADPRNCSLCSDNTHGFGFKCEECPFGLHVGCALQSLSATKEELTLNSELLHKHPMRLQCLTKGYVCIVCEWPVKGLGYAYEICGNKAIHKTCAELPRESERHPIHPQRLLLLLSKPLDEFSHCFACLESSGGLTFYCDYCKIQFYAHCAMRRPTLKHRRHEHCLSYFRKIGRKPYSVQCNVCYDYCWIDFYRCVRCNYNLHFSCMPLPPSVKHAFHQSYHPLVLRDRFVDDKLDYEEQYCDVCETLRHPEHGVYYCEECNYAADIDCIIPKRDLKKGRQMKDFMLKRLDKDISIAEAMTEELKKKWEMSMKELKNSRKRGRSSQTRWKQSWTGHELNMEPFSWHIVHPNKDLMHPFVKIDFLHHVHLLTVDLILR
ncbi:uncharacterized protein LOC116209312 [Punica granatum]|uniref:Uncharacterized protein LOC116209312 n=1 Tax=Punica granatum TaxID=22663 RepID=A0A6P8DS67_PUNGR|nr:uncharacterized protein LOC116209312 [Punica granatum]